jgi:uncharacterized protein YdbL (DUF1318 family)
MKPAGWIVAAALLAATPPAVSQPAAALASAIQAGQVGEKFDGYMGFSVAPSAEVRRQVQAINLRRRNLYIELGVRRNVTAAVVGIATACQLLRQLTPGEAYQLEDGVWRRWIPGQPLPVPRQCG